MEQCHILIIDDEVDSALYVARILKKNGFVTVSTSNEPHDAITRYMESGPDLVIVDLHIPVFSGIEIMRAIRGLDPEGEYVPVIMMTGDLGPSAKRLALEAGCNDFVDKFSEEFEFLLRVKNCLRTRLLHLGMKSQNAVLEQQVYNRTRDLMAAQEEVVQRLAAASEYRDDVTGQHVERVGTLAADLAGAIGLSRKEIELIRRGAKLHDIGKIGIPDTILYKEGPLTVEERRVMERHTIIGDQILANGSADLIRTAQTIARSHHERWDGSGYPDKLAAENIPLPGRIVAIADVYDALITKRPYKEAFPLELAREIILTESGRHFDPHLVEAFQALPPTAVVAT
jgi:putative two-component system response regulator